MRRSHVFERSSPRIGRDAYQEPANQLVVARSIAVQLGSIIDRASGANLSQLASLLEAAREEAERALRSIDTAKD